MRNKKQLFDFIYIFVNNLSKVDLIKFLIKDKLMR